MPSKKRAFKQYFFYAKLAAEHAIEESNKGNSVFVALNPRSQMSAFEADVPYVTTIGLDLQPEKTPIEEVEKRLAIGNILPTATSCSGGGVHMYFRLSEPADPTKAKVVWQRLCRFTGSDAIFNVNRIFRVTGSYNWKSHPPRPCYFTALAPERAYTIEEINAALDRLGAGPAVPPKAGMQVPVDTELDLFKLFQNLPEDVYYAIKTGERNQLSDGQVTRSETDWLVVCALVKAGVSDDGIAYIYANFPIGLLKYYEAGAHYLTKTIESARRATAEPIEHTRAYHRHKLPSGSAGDKRRR